MRLHRIQISNLWIQCGWVFLNFLKCYLFKKNKNKKKTVETHLVPDPGVCQWVSHTLCKNPIYFISLKVLKKIVRIQKAAFSRDVTWLRMPPHALTGLSAVVLISYLPWQDLMCSCSQSGACASCPSLTVSMHPRGSDTCQCVFCPTPRDTLLEKSSLRGDHTVVGHR